MPSSIVRSVRFPKSLSGRSSPGYLSDSLSLLRTTICPPKVPRLLKQLHGTRHGTSRSIPAAKVAVILSHEHYGIFEKYRSYKRFGLTSATRPRMYLVSSSLDSAPSCERFLLRVPSPHWKSPTGSDPFYAWSSGKIGSSMPNLPSADLRRCSASLAGTRITWQSPIIGC
jgi:hypothetical protein